MTCVLLAVALGNLGDDDVAVLDFAPDDFVDVVHIASSILWHILCKDSDFSLYIFIFVCLCRRM